MTQAEAPRTPSRAEVTQGRILDAAFAEFSTHGVAGARVDRIAKTAGCNKNLIYIYFGSKEGLFDAVMTQRLKLVYEDHPLTPENLPEYAGKTFDFAMQNPDVIKLLAWSKLDPTVQPPEHREHSVMKKVAMLRAAQRDGALTDAYDPEFLITLVMSLATAWVPAFPYGTSGVSKKKLREQIVRAVAAVVAAASPADSGEHAKHGVN
ncbi:TetR/AcrR family transcriptional regulator [Gryllotalpicola ginsengisoli]|uniref:TetR/AcrR family transcriptional regulator n=1 Tax=Gryllotalpicola ginsengisoli TaxID=444608 RepID=UPI0003B4BF87|nr:TetR/AcrR family transcriptional regulator [Gryllotalpicola ginsengisoli]